MSTFDIDSPKASGTAMRFDLAQAFGDYQRGGTVGESETATFGWTISVDIAVPFSQIFDQLSATLGISISESKGLTNSHTWNLLPNDEARIVHYPMYGWALMHTTEVPWYSVPPDFTPHQGLPIDRGDVTYSWPTDGGTWDIQTRYPTVYTDSQYGGVSYPLAAGNHYGDFPANTLSSIRVPPNYTVYLFSDPGFQNQLAAYGGPYDEAYVGDGRNDMTQSIRVTSP